MFGKGLNKAISLPKELYQSRQLIWKLAKNDFKKRYAGSYLGAIWAVVQPAITIAMYYVVFDIIMKTGGNGEVPYVLFLTTGIIPWFYFNEGLQNGTHSLLEYSYLVKKVVFKISILPIIRIIAATFVHIFLVGVIVILGCIYGYYPNIYSLQLIYYSFCLFILMLGISYITSSVTVFFRDMGQLVTVALQVGIWATPIFWDIKSMGPKAQFIMNLNPVAYVVEGYRSTFFEKKWFFENVGATIYFWLITIGIFSIGALVFKRLKVHFADVL